MWEPGICLCRLHYCLGEHIETDSENCQFLPYCSFERKRGKEDFCGFVKMRHEMELVMSHDFVQRVSEGKGIGIGIGEQETVNRLSRALHGCGRERKEIRVLTGKNG